MDNDTIMNTNNNTAAPVSATPSPDVPVPAENISTNEPAVNPLLARVRMPGETFTLPSGGLFYNNGELRSDVKNGEVHVLPMTAIDEIVIKTPDMLYSGDAINDVFNRCIPQILKPKELLAKDVDFLMICLRKVSFGPEMEITAAHDCDKAEDHSYMISMDKFIQDSKRIDPTTISSDYSLDLPNGQRISLQPIRYQSFVELMRLNDNDYAKKKKKKRTMFNTLLDVIVSVDDITESVFIEEWLNTLPAGWLHKINEKINSVLEWGPTFTTTVVCQDCDKPMQVTAPLNPVAFFT